MKKWVLILAALLALLITGAAAEDVPMYEAMVNDDVFLVSDTVGGPSYGPIADGQKVIVYELGDEWCRVEYKGQMGYCKTRWLYHYRSLDPFRFSVPQMQDTIGFASFMETCFLSGGKFNGIDVQAGAIFCVSQEVDEGYLLPVWRGETQVAKEDVTFYPFVSWQDAQPGDIIGGFTTFYSAQQGKGRAMEREHNIQVGCQRIHETVLKPDAYFSFNRACAPYSKKNGYLYAPNISKTGYGYGGGVCQVTTTLYNAVLTLPLQVDEWALHKYNGVAYVPQFFDAAVGSYTDLVFKNTMPYAIRLAAMAQDGVLTVLIFRH